MLTLDTHGDHNTHILIKSDEWPDGFTVTFRPLNSRELFDLKGLDDKPDEEKLDLLDKTLRGTVTENGDKYSDWCDRMRGVDFALFLDCLTRIVTETFHVKLGG